MGYFNKTSYLFLQTDTKNNALRSFLYSIKSSAVSHKPVIIAIIKTMITTWRNVVTNHELAVEAIYGVYGGDIYGVECY